MPPGMTGRQTAPKSLMSPKVYRPTMEEFSDFMGFINKIEVEDNAHEAGFCKIIPPKEWNPRKSGYDLKDLNFTIEGPIKQTFKTVGEQGCYQTKGIIQPKMNVVEYHEMVRSSRYATPNHTDYDDLEKKYWKSVSFNSPIYGCDVANTISDPDLKIWNIAKLDSILKYVQDDLDMNIMGVNTPYLYFGMWKATFSWHVEDMDLYAINMVHHGAPKTWYCVPPKYGHILERACKDLFPNIAAGCSNFMRHKTCLLAPHILDKYGVPYQKMHQEEREIMVTFPYAYHSGFNHGFNIAESTNFATERWINYGKRARPCDCERSRVKFSMDTFVEKFQPEKFDAWKSGLDIEPHPEDPPDVADEIRERARDPREFARQIEERNRNKQRKLKEKEKKNTEKETIFEVDVYQLVVNRRIEVEVENEPFKVVSKLDVLEKYLQRKGVDIKQMMEAGELVWAGTRPIKVNKKRKLEAPEDLKEPKKEPPAEDCKNFIVEKKTVSLYRHIVEVGLHVSVDPVTKEITHVPSERLLAFMKSNHSSTVKSMIEAGVFRKICDCIMEVKKIEKPVVKVKAEQPVAKKIKTEPEIKQEPGLTPTPAGKQAFIKHLDLYCHKGTGFYFTLSKKSLKVIGRLSKEKEAVLANKSIKELIDEGELRQVGTRKQRNKVKPAKFKATTRQGVFKLAWDDKDTEFELAAQGDRFVVCLTHNQAELFDVFKNTQSQALINALAMIRKSQESSPLKIFEAMLNNSLTLLKSEDTSPGSLIGTENVQALLKKYFPDSNFTPDFSFDQMTITFKDPIEGGRVYLIRQTALPPEVFEIAKEKPTPPPPKVEPLKATDFDDDLDDDDDDDDDEELFTSDESSESNDDDDDETYGGSGHFKEWKAVSMMKKKRRRREREERRMRRLYRRERRVNRKQQNFKEDGPVYLKVAKKLLKVGQAELQGEKENFTVEELAATYFEGAHTKKLICILRIFNGLKIVKQVRYIEIIFEFCNSISDLNCRTTKKSKNTLGWGTALRKCRTFFLTSSLKRLKKSCSQKIFYGIFVFTF